MLIRYQLVKFHVMLLLVKVICFLVDFASNLVNLASTVSLMILIKIPASQWRAVRFTLKSAMASNLIILAASSMITQLQNLWVLYTNSLQLSCF